MKRNLLIQMRNEWRDNLWLMLGLAIVSLTIWLFCSALFSTTKNYFLPLGFDEEDVYVLSVGHLEPTAPTYIDFGELTREKASDDMRGLIARIRESQNVEVAAFSDNGTPYKMSAINSGLNIIGEEPDTIGFVGNFRSLSPEGVKVLRLRSLTGKDENYLKGKLESGEILVSPDPYWEREKMSVLNEWGVPVSRFPAEELVGKNVIMNNDSASRYHVADAVALVRRSSFDNPWGGGVILPINEAGDICRVREILVRVKPGNGDKFCQEFESTPDMLSRRNTYLYGLTSLSDMGTAVEKDDVLDVRLYVALIIFFLIILFLGLLGTFWFRMQQRVSEIAIRRVCGASRWAIFRRVFGEGMLLLIGASVLAAIVGWAFIKQTDLIQGFSDIELIWFELATMAIVAVGIVLSIIYPAWRAMQIEPAEAVRDE
ncbi:MAG: FtsX-like permease family protein [Muribaculaceae bacterium]|nr:FtsX-like permease family protein [Muribaculaceae bacterium]